MKAYNKQDYKHNETLRSTTNTARLVAKNADRSHKKTIRQETKLSLKEYM
jgi:hypothetical protein